MWPRLMHRIQFSAKVDTPITVEPNPPKHTLCQRTVKAIYSILKYTRNSTIHIKISILKTLSS